MTELSMLKRMFEQNYKLNETIDSALKAYEPCYYNGTKWIPATALIAPTGILAEKLSATIGNIVLGSEMPIDSINGTAVTAPIVTNSLYYYNPATGLVSTTAVGYTIGRGYVSTNGIGLYGSILINLNQSGVGSGTVTSVSVATINGFGGVVTNPTTTPEINLYPTVFGVLKGVAGPDRLASAVADVDYLAPTSNLIWKESKTTWTPAEIQNSFSAPLTILPAPGAGKSNIIQGIAISKQYNGIVYVNNLDMTAAYGFGGATVGIFVGAQLLGSITDSVVYVANIFTNTTINTAIQLYCTAGNTTLGDSSIKVTVYYKTITV